MPYSGAALSLATFPSTAPAVSAPTRLRLPDLMHATDRYADDVLHGRFNVWLISWVPGHTTELHDHGGSLGALTVLSGALHEYRWDGERLHRRRLDAGDQAAFPLGWVHDVVRARGSAPADPPASATLSVHAYSPPLTAMSYYEVTQRNTLRRTRTELTDEPEGQ